MAWTDIDDDFLKAHYNRDLSASQIGDVMGRTKGQIIGRARILGLHQHRTDGDGKQLDLELGPPLARCRPTVASLLARPAAAPNAVQITKVKPRSKPVSVLPLGSISPWKTCQWVIGDPAQRTFCGSKTVDGTSWCAHHYAIVFTTRAQAEQAEPLPMAEAA